MWIWRYNRSRLINLLFFLQQLSGKTVVMLYKSCTVFHQEANKIGFAFSDFPTIFYRVSKIQPNTKYYARSTLQSSPCTVSIPSRCTLSLQIGPQKDLRPGNWVLGEEAGATPARPAAVIGWEQEEDG
jgi:hypothetical protein